MAGSYAKRTLVAAEESKQCTPERGLLLRGGESKNRGERNSHRSAEDPSTQGMCLADGRKKVEGQYETGRSPDFRRIYAKGTIRKREKRMIGVRPEEVGGGGEKKTKTVQEKIVSSSI